MKKTHHMQRCWSKNIIILSVPQMDHLIFFEDSFESIQLFEYIVLMFINKKDQDLQNEYGFLKNDNGKTLRRV